jgi:hypothetical protein
VRTGLWLAISFPYVAIITIAHFSNGDPMQLLADRRLVIEEIAILLTAVTAAAAAFCSVVPGYDRRILALPLAPLAVWMVMLGESCIGRWLRADAGTGSAELGWQCLPPAVLIGIVPAFAVMVMLRRGAPLAPRLTLALGALAVAALANFGLRLFHPSDASLLVLAVHFGSVAALALAGGSIGRRLLNWRTAQFETAP